MRMIKNVMVFLWMILFSLCSFNLIVKADEARIDQTTSVIIYCKDKSTDRILKTEEVTDLIAGDPYTYVPASELNVEGMGVFLCDKENANNKLTIDSLYANPKDNIIVAYYDKQAIPGRHYVAYLYLKDAESNKTIKEVRYWFGRIPPLYSPEDSFTKNLSNYVHYNEGALSYTPVAAFAVDNQVSYVFDKGNLNNILAIPSLKWDSSYNIITAYYKKISKENISKATIKVSNTVYNGKPKKPKVSVKYNGKILRRSKDYTISYKNNKKVGKATVTVSGIGNYTGTINDSFYIKPKTNKIQKLTNKKGRKLIIKITGSKGAKGYEISYANNKKFKSARKITTARTVRTISNLKKNKTYYVRVRAYAKINGKKLFSAYSKTCRVKIKK